MQTFFRRYGTAAALLLVLILAAALRLMRLDQIPPALHADEAPNAWNAYTLLKTGMDQYGVSWPIFYTRAFGDNRSTLYIYALLPFQALGGLNVWTTRLPAAAGGVLTVWLLYFVGARLFGRVTGLAAAAMLAVNPWHLQTSRWGHEASIVPLLITAPLAALLWANLPLDDHEERRPRPLRAALAGALVGICCYGYQSVRLFLPLFLLAAFLAAPMAWLGRLKTRDGALAIGTLVLTAAITFGPLLWRHVVDPEISRRAQIQGWVWNQSDATEVKVTKALSRYPGHFGLDFLFINGDGDPALASPPGTGLFYWYDLPFMVLGLVFCLSRVRSSRPAGLLLLWLLLYPAADLLNEHPTLHALRSLPGLPGLILLAAVGAVVAGEWLWRRRQTTFAIGFALALAVIALDARFLREFFGESFNRQKYSLAVWTADIFEAAEWLKPRLGGLDAVFITGYATHPDIVTLVGLGYDPRQWFRDVRELAHGPLPDGRYKYAYIYHGYGKIHFMFGAAGEASLKRLTANSRADRVVFIVRPGEWALSKRFSPVHEIVNPKGQTVLQIFDTVL